MSRFCLALLAFAPAAFAGIGDGRLYAPYGDGGRNVTGFTQSDTVHQRGIVQSPFGPSWSFGDDTANRAALYVSRTTADGQPDTSFGFNSSGQLIDTLPPGLIAQTQAWSMAGATIQVDGKPLVYGGMQAVNGQAGAYPGLVCRLAAAGNFEVAFGSGGCATLRSFLSSSETCRVTGAAADPDGSIVAVGNCLAENLAERPFLARLTASGTLDTEFGAGLGLITPAAPLASISSQHYAAVRVRPDHRIVVLGEFRMTSNNVTDLEIGVLQFDAGGSADATFSGNGFRVLAFDQGGDNDDSARDMTLRPDGKLLVLGQARVPSPSRTLALLAQLTANGSLDPSFGTNGLYVDDYASVLGPDGSLASIALDERGRAVVSGTRAEGQVNAVSHAGTDFWIALPYVTPPSFTAHIFVASDTIASGTVVNTASGLSVPFNVVPGVVVDVSIPDTLQLDDSLETIESKALHITATAPIVVSEVNGRAQTLDATLALPTPILGTHYRVMSWGHGIGVGSSVTVVASAANTSVTITPAATVAGHLAGVPFAVALQPGQAYHLAPGNDTDLTGTRVSANKPVAVYGSHPCALVPNELTDFCDAAIEQMVPIERWGQDFYTAPSVGRSAGDVIRVLADQGGTAVYVDGVLSATLAAGQVYDVTRITATHFHTDKPASVAQFAQGCKLDTPDNTCKGDPYMTMIAPTTQWQSRYLAVAPAMQSQNYTQYLRIVAPSAAVGSITINNVTIPLAQFSPIGSSGYSSAQLVVPAGRFVLAANQPIHVDSYGFSSSEAYAFPAAAVPLTVQSNADDVIVRHDVGGLRDSRFGVGGIAQFDHAAYYGSPIASLDTPVRALVDPSGGVLVGTASTNHFTGQSYLLNYRLIGDTIFQNDFE